MAELIEYKADTGKLVWKPRPLSMFNSERACNSWNSRCAGKEALKTSDKKGYLFGPVMNTLFKAHRVAWAIHYGEWPNGDIDHINQVKDDNRINNLRVCTDSENLRNIPMFSTNKSGYKGVSFDKRQKKWTARISTGNSYKSLGYFSSPEKASDAYIIAAKYYHGEFFTTKMVRDQK